MYHFDRSISIQNFFTDIDNGLDFPDFRKNRAVKQRFMDMTDRLEMFSCIYHAMRACRVFAVPSGIVRGTKTVKADYIVYYDINGEGMNIGLRTTDNNILVPVTILSDRKSQQGKHIDTNNEKLIGKLEIIDAASKSILENINFS